MYFYSGKGVEGVVFTILFQNIPIHSLILSSSMLLKGWFWPLKALMFLIQTPVGCTLKKAKSAGGASKTWLWLAWCLISKSSFPGGTLCSSVINRYMRLWCWLDVEILSSFMFMLFPWETTPGISYLSANVYYSLAFFDFYFGMQKWDLVGSGVRTRDPLFGSLMTLPLNH